MSSDRQRQRGESSTQRANRTGGRPQGNQGQATQYPTTRGALAGAAGFVAALLSTYVLAQLDSDLGDSIDSTVDDLGEIGVDTLDVVIWTFFNAQFVDVVLSGTVDGESERNTFSLLSGDGVPVDGASFPELLYTAVPVIALVAAGYLLVRSAGARTGQEAATSGALVSVGYFPLVMLAALFSRNSGTEETLFGEFEATYTVELLEAALIAGFVLPLAFGALGGYLAFRRGRGGR